MHLVLGILIFLFYSMYVRVLIYFLCLTIKSLLLTSNLHLLLRNLVQHLSLQTGHLQLKLKMSCIHQVIIFPVPLRETFSISGNKLGVSLQLTLSMLTHSDGWSRARTFLPYAVTSQIHPYPGAFPPPCSPITFSVDKPGMDFLLSDFHLSLRNAYQHLTSLTLNRYSGCLSQAP